MAQRAALLALLLAAVIYPAAPARAQWLQSDPWVEPGIVSTGDGDLYVEPNEHVRMRPRLHNDGFDPDTLTTVRGTLDWSGIVSAPSGQLIWPDLAPHESAPAINELAIDPMASYAFECGQELQVDIDVQTDQGRKWAPLTIPTGEPDGRCQNDNNIPPRFSLRLYQTPAYVGNWNQIGFWDTQDPDGWIASVRVTVNGRDVTYEGDYDGGYSFQWHTLGRRVVRVSMTDNDGATTTKTFNVDVVPKQVPRQYGGRPPTIGPRFSFFVPRRYRTKTANRIGIPVRVHCRSGCAAAVELQLTRYRARKLGIRPLPKQRKITISSGENHYWNGDHSFRLRPDLAAVRRALRRHRRVPVLLKVTSFGPTGITRSTQAEIDLIGVRRR